MKLYNANKLRIGEQIAKLLQIFTLREEEHVLVSK